MSKTKKEDVKSSTNKKKKIIIGSIIGVVLLLIIIFLNYTLRGGGKRQLRFHESSCKCCFSFRVNKLFLQ